MISGWFGINPTLKKASAVIFQVIFFWGGIFGTAYLLGIPIPYRACLNVFYFGNHYWFLPAYLGLYVLAPVLNSFIETAKARLVFGVLLSFFILQFIYGWTIPNDTAYVLNMHPITLPYFKQLMIVANYETGYMYPVFVIFTAVVILALSIILDRVRIYVWKVMCHRFMDSVFAYIQQQVEKMFYRLRLFGK